MLSRFKVLIHNLTVYDYTINANNAPSIILNKLDPKLNLNLVVVKHSADREESSSEYEPVISAKKGPTTPRESKRKKTSGVIATPSLKRL